MRALVKSKKVVFAVILVILVLVTSHQDLLIGYAHADFGTFMSCPNQITYADIVDVNGFVTTNERYKGQPGRPGLYDFVLKPNSTGHITMNYEFLEDKPEDIARRYNMTLEELFKSDPIEELFKLDARGIPLSVEKIGVSIYSSNITMITDYVIRVTYTVKAESSAERGTYLMTIFQTCPGELLTVGEKPYEGSLPWDPKFLPPLSQPTTSGKFKVDISWSPVTIEPGKPITIWVMIRDEQQNVIKDARYDFLISDAGGKVLLDERNVTTTLGQGTHEVTFESSGTARIIVTYLRSLSDLENKITERAEFDLIVVPEFPLGAVVVMTIVMAMFIIVTRLKLITMPKLQ